MESVQSPMRRDWLNDRRKEERHRVYVLFAVVLLLAGLVYVFLIWLIGSFTLPGN
jgi:multidrug resistance efflux pump